MKTSQNFDATDSSEASLQDDADRQDRRRLERNELDVECIVAKGALDALDALELEARGAIAEYWSLLSSPLQGDSRSLQESSGESPPTAPEVSSGAAATSELEDRFEDKEQARRTQIEYYGQHLSQTALEQRIEELERPLRDRHSSLIVEYKKKGELWIYAVEEQRRRMQRMQLSDPWMYSMIYGSDPERCDEESEDWGEDNLGEQYFLLSMALQDLYISYK